MPRLPPDPLGVPRNPFQVYILCLAIVAGTPLLFGVTTANSVEASLPPAYVFAWGLMLVAGSATTLAGMFWPGARSTGLLVKRTGLTSVGSAAVIYCTILALFFGVGAGLVILITIGFAVACFWQIHQINAHIKDVLASQ